MDILKIEVPARSDSESWFLFISNSLEKVSGIKYLIIDFNRISFLETDDFVILACLIESFYINGCEISFVGGTNKFNDHLHNIKFKRYWEPGFNRERFTSSLNNTTLCLWKISKTMKHSYSDYAKKYFRNTFMKGMDLLPLATNLDEVFNNIFDHSKSKVNGYIITQFFPHLNKLSFSVCDFGVGIPNSINTYKKKNGEDSVEDPEAILLSLELGYSVKSTPRNRGFGLNNILELTESSNGELIIVSNNGVYKKRAGCDYQIGYTENAFNGTLLKVEVDTKTFELLDESEEIFDF